MVLLYVLWLHNSHNILHLLKTKPAVHAGLFPASVVVEFNHSSLANIQLLCVWWLLLNQLFTSKVLTKTFSAVKLQLSFQKTSWHRITFVSAILHVMTISKIKRFFFFPLRCIFTFDKGIWVWFMIFYERPDCTWTWAATFWTFWCNSVTSIDKLRSTVMFLNRSSWKLKMCIF